MERHLGADVHAASVTFCVRNESGRQLRHDVVGTNRKALLGYFREIPRNEHPCIEEGAWSHWLVEILSPHVGDPAELEVGLAGGELTIGLDLGGRFTEVRVLSDGGGLDCGGPSDAGCRSNSGNDRQ
jgi:hypothetical protein